MNGVQLARLTCDRLTSTTNRTIATLRITMTLLTRADSRIPITNTADITATMRTAGRLMIAPVGFSPTWEHPAACAATCAAVHNCVGGAVRLAGIWTPKSPTSDTQWADQPTPTVAAPAAHSSTRTHPIIYAANSPVVSQA